MKAKCHCGNVALEISSPPKEVTSCNCSICRRYGVLWAYYRPAEVRLEPADPNLDTYQWDDRAITFNRCAICGCVTHWSPNDPLLDRMGINARLFDPGILAAAKIRYLDGAGTEEYIDE